ncbi:MAG: amidohydrolase family protein [Flavobacteriales bacterium]|nr:amidohydrolase family protein [Flavobacteriales bacterium]
MNRILVLILLLFTSHQLAVSQETFHINGVANKTELVHAFTNAKIYLDHKTVIENATLIIKNQLIIGVGTDVKIPKGAVIHDLKGKVIYPSFIDLYSSYGMPKVKKHSGYGWQQYDKIDEDVNGWNMAIRAEVDAVELFEINDGAAKGYRNNGFGAVLTSQNDGIVRGTSVLVDLDNKHEHHSILKKRASMGFSFEKGSSPQAYPTAHLGASALLKQSYHDAIWYEQVKNKEYDATWEAFNEFRNLPQIFEVGDYIEKFRADNIGDAFGDQYIIKGSGDQYRRIDEMKKTGATFIVPLNFPLAFDVTDDQYTRMLQLADMKHWEMAPANAAKLEEAQINFVFTADGLKKKGDFLKNIRKAISYGLSEETALRAITSGPAELIGVEDQIGALKKGMRANFIISKGNVFDAKNVIYENWVGGSQHIIKPINFHNPTGEYSLLIGARTYKLMVTGKPEKPKGKLKISDTTKVDVHLRIDGHNVSLNFGIGENEYYRLAGSVDFKSNSWAGTGKDKSGNILSWSTAYAKEITKKDKKKPDKEKEKPSVGAVWFPNKAYGFKEHPTQKTTLIKNATVWTNEEAGTLKETDVLLRDGKIAAIGKNLTAEGAEIIDATGMHLTVGIIDEHVHFALRGGLNEGATNCSAEVDENDVIYPEDVRIYQILAGGVSTVQLLHGSANLIGGKSAIVKLRWGKTANEMVLQGADKFIKFALGENTTEHNERSGKRLPGTRLGMDGYYRDMFNQAVIYKQQWETYNALSASKQQTVKRPKKNLRLDGLVSILNGELHITCHSYLQSEMMMLLRVSDDYGFKINTFTHGMETYKIADELAKRGVTASIFSDWWGYKIEAEDGIPQAAGILFSEGVNVCFNSDIAYQSNRLNHDVAKAIKYAGLSEEDTWKLITLNPAKALHLDDRLGSVKVGKDADVVIWSGHPMSLYSKVEKNFVDGIVYFDRQRDLELRAEIKKERARLIAKMLVAAEDGEKTRKPVAKERKDYNCLHQ